MHRPLSRIRVKYPVLCKDHCYSLLAQTKIPYFDDTDRNLILMPCRSGRGGCARNGVSCCTRLPPSREPEEPNRVGDKWHLSSLWHFSFLGVNSFWTMLHSFGSCTWTALAWLFIYRLLKVIRASLITFGSPLIINILHRISYPWKCLKLFNLALYRETERTTWRGPAPGPSSSPIKQ